VVNVSLHGRMKTKKEQRDAQEALEDLE